MFMRWAINVADLGTVLRIAIFRDFSSTLFNYAVNVGFTVVAIFLMRRMHAGAYKVFYNFITGALDPSVLMVMASLAILLIGFEFIFLGLSFYPRGHIPAPFTKLVFSLRDSIVVLSGVAFGLALFMFAGDPIARWNAYAIAVIYLGSAYLMAFLCCAPFYLDSEKWTDRVSLLLAGAGLVLLVWYWPDLFSPEHFQFSELLR